MAAKSKQNQTKRRHRSTLTEVDSEQWISKKADHKRSDVNKLKAWFGASKSRNPFIEVHFSSEPIEIKQTKQTSLKKYFVKHASDGSSEVGRSSLVTHQNRDIDVQDNAENGTTAPENVCEMNLTESCLIDRIDACASFSGKEQMETKNGIIGYEEHTVKEDTEDESDKCRSQTQHRVARKEQLQTLKKIKRPYSPSDVIVEEQITGKASLSASSRQLPDNTVCCQSKSHPDAPNLNKPLDDFGTRGEKKICLCSGSCVCSDSCLDKQKNHKGLVLEAVEQFAIKLKMVKRQVLSNWKQTETKPGELETEPLTFHVMESCCDPGLDYATSCDQLVAKKQLPDEDKYSHSESCDMTFHIPEDDLMAGNQHALEDSELSDLTFH